MSEIIQPYTPLYRNSNVYSCAKCEPIHIGVGQEYIFWMPYPVNMGTTVTQLVYEQGGNTYSLAYEILADAGNGGNFCRINWTNNNKITLLINDFAGSNIVMDVKGKCLTFRLATVTAVFPDTYINYTGDVYTLHFFDPDRCGNDYQRIDYALNCRHIMSYTYWLKGSIRRRPKLLADELNAISPDGQLKRIYSRYITPYLLRSYPFGWVEHDFIENILATNEITVNNNTYSPSEGGVWTVKNPDDVYSTGFIDLVGGADVARYCCEVDESS